MNSLAPILIVLSLATAYGFWYQRSRGRIRASHKGPAAALSSEILGGPLGSRATLVQFSSAFCTPCRVTRILLENVVSALPDVVHIEIDAEAHLDLVRKLNIHSTPTTLILNSQGVEVGRAVGAPNRDQVLNSLASLR
ncbi:MAG TPA: thioredoxin family protein [Candidatus Paceibacterota bacterium]|nr:thioredoxin family protein [Candidatus Paceibacterota bacterium]